MTGPGDRAAAHSVRIAAAGDVHCREAHRDATVEAFAALNGQADLLLLAGDLTAHGEPAEAAILADACLALDLPAIAVLGNHDWHAGRQQEIVDVLTGAGVAVLERDSTTLDLDGVEIGVVGAKGFVGGFAGSHLPDFGEPLLRAVYAETTADVDAIDRGLRAVATCPIRIVVLHYSPAAQTLEGEPPGIWAFLGSERLAAPIAEHAPDLVLHGHAHAGTFEGRIAAVPVYNVSVPVMNRDFWTFELTIPETARSAVH